jgi:glycerophosphoryl diester phosphodiesterase
MKKSIYRVGIAVLFALVGTALVVGFWRPGILLGQPNDGHQLGGDLMDDLSGNTIECFVRGIEKFEASESWMYSECDIRETRDHHLVVFHDWDISCVPDSPENQMVLGEPVRKQAVCDLTLQQIQGLELECGCRIPTLEEILEKACELKIKKPLLLEFKHLHSDGGRERFLELATQYRDQHELEIHFLSFVRNVQICFPDSKAWLERFSKADFRVYQVFRPKKEEYDLCDTWEQ